MGTTISDRVVRYFKTSFGSEYQFSNSQVSIAATSAARDIIGKTPAPVIRELITNMSVSDGTGADITQKKVTGSKRGGYPAMEVSYNLSGSVSDANSLYYASEVTPVYYIQNGKLYIKPDPTAGTNGTVEYIIYPSLAYNDDESNPPLDKFPKTMFNLIVMYIVHDVLQKEANYHREMLDTKFDSIDTQINEISTLTDALNSYQISPMSTMPDLTVESISNVTISDLATEPSFDTQVISGLPASIDLDEQTSISISDINEPVFNAPSLDTFPSIDLDSSVDIDLSNIDIPSFNEPVPQIDLSTFDTEHNDEDIELAQQSLDKEQTHLSEFQNEIQQEVQTYQSKISDYQAQVQATIEEAAQESSINTKKYSALVNKVLGKYKAQTEEELSRYQGAVQLYINKVQNRIQRKAQENQLDVSKYKTTVDKVLNQFQAEVGQAIQKLQTDMQKYSIEIQAERSAKDLIVKQYSSKVNTIINEHRSEIEGFNAKINHSTQSISARMDTVGVYLKEIQSLFNRSQLASKQAENTYAKYQRELSIFAGVDYGNDNS